MRNFKELKIWQNGFRIAILSFRMTKTFPAEEKFGLAAQINKAAISIPSNIAEGSSRKSEKDYKRFVEIALGSAFELETQLLIAREINYGDISQLNLILKMLEEEVKMLHAFIKSLSDVKG